ncbi:MAG: NYN domain-containing protein [Clostridia bacterium]|nr:NYN domain-containing protein [Clostridia bacterium]
MREETVAILVDGAFYQRRAQCCWGEREPGARAEELERYCKSHLKYKVGDHYEYDTLYRIFYYDCPPATDSVFHPLYKKTISLKATNVFRYNSQFQKELLRHRKFALRLGKLDTNNLHYLLTYDAQKRLLDGRVSFNMLTEKDFVLNIQQKGVDMRIGLDISALAYKKLVTRIILISGDSDFVPAAKLARREGIDFILDPMGMQGISDDLLEHIDGLRSKVKHDPLQNKAER